MRYCAQKVLGRLYRARSMIKSPNKADYADLLTYDPLYLIGNEDNKRRFVEFANASDAQRFIDEQSCTVQYDNSCKPIGHP